MENKRWYVVYVNSRAEKKVRDLLLNKRVEVYVPIIKSLRQWSDRRKMIDQPLLSGYVFVKIDSNEIESVLSTKNVVNFVKDGSKLAVVKEYEIQRLIQYIELGYQIEVDSIMHSYSKGDNVVIKSGVLKNINAEVVSYNGGHFVELLLESIGQCIRVKLPREIIEPQNKKLINA